MEFVLPLVTEQRKNTEFVLHLGTEQKKTVLSLCPLVTEREKMHWVCVTVGYGAKE